MEQKKVLVGVSGGVDSSVSLALLKKQNYAVSAVFFRFWGTEKSAEKAISDVKSVCEILDVPFQIIDARKEFEKTVIKYFLDEYAAGRTPNPCIFCNEKMKFKLLLDLAKKGNFDFVATGHYAKIPPNPPFEKGERKLFQAKDESKDQSYFLYRLKQDQLAKILFPLGDYKKTEVRELAKKFGLPVFDKSESQDVCFMADNDLEKFLAKEIKLKKGKIMDENGKVLGEHKGLALYTIGQRKGINIGGRGPYFVVSKDILKNNLVVTNDLQNSDLFKKSIKLEKMNWTSGEMPKLPLEISARTRYHNPLVRAIIKIGENEGECELEFEKPQKAISPGQSAVFYAENGEVLGGGIIS